MQIQSIKKIIKGMIEVKGKRVIVVDRKKLESEKWDELVVKAVMGSEGEKTLARWIIWEVGQSLGVRPASMNDLYMARGREEIDLDFTVPAMNLRGMVYDMARAVFKAAKRLKVGVLICELARSEMEYTDQSPEEFAAVVLAGAIREGWRGGIPIQGDHFQAKQVGPGEPKKGEIDLIKKLTKESIEAGFYNIDIDMSTLVDLGKPTEQEQQEPNVKYCLEMVRFIRKIEPKGVVVSLGGEIGHIGGKNSTVEDLRGYMKGFNAGLDEGMVGMSKISVATGTHHGGVVLADGSLADIPVDFKVLGEVSRVGRKKYQIGGGVQHGASTLPDEFFSQFTKAEAIEVHLATGFQNIMMDHPRFPKELIKNIYKWLDKEKIDEKKEGQTDEQFHYKLRKKAWGKFKKECWMLGERVKSELRKSLEERFEFLFKELNVTNTEKLGKRWIRGVEMSRKLDDFGKGGKVREVRGLSD